MYWWGDGVACCMNMDRMKNTLRRLAAMEADFTVFPGHGESTTLAREKQYNPYMR